MKYAVLPAGDRQVMLCADGVRADDEKIDALRALAAQPGIGAALDGQLLFTPVHVGSERDVAAEYPRALVTAREWFENFFEADARRCSHADVVRYCVELRERGLLVPGMVEKPNARYLEQGLIRRESRVPHGHVLVEVLPTPKTTVICHGDARIDEGMLRANAAPVERVIYVESARAAQTARKEMELRGDRYLALVDARCTLRAGWLDDLVGAIEFPGAGAALCAAQLDARCALLALANFPQHERLAEDATLHEGLADFLLRGIAHRAAIRVCETAKVLLPSPPCDATLVDPPLVERICTATPRRRAGLVSIIMLSWNAPEFTKIALDSIRAHTSGDYEVVIVDNGSGPETVDWLRTLPDVRVVFNATNRGFAGGNNDGLAAARGEYVVLLNNDVVVTEGWLDDLLSAFDRIPRLGVSAPRSNKIAGDQIVPDATYASIEEMHAYAARRRARHRHTGYLTDRAIGLCLCIDRRVIEEVGGIDERFGVGNFEDDDFCMRVRAAGYRIYVCDDVFIHHYGSQTFKANNVDWNATMDENWKKFASKWGLPPVRSAAGYVPAPVIRRGFDRAKHYVPLSSAEPQRAYDLVFAAAVRSERDWNAVANFARRFLRAFSADEPVLLAIAAAGEVCAQALADRLARLAQKEGLQPETVPDVEVADEQFPGSFIAALPQARRFRVNGWEDSTFDALPEVPARSPSALRRLLRGVPA